MLSILPVSLLSIAKHLSHPSTSLIFHCPQNHFVPYPFFFSSPFVPIFLIHFKFPLNMSTAENTAESTLNINCHNFILSSNVMQSAEFKEGFPTLPADMTYLFVWVRSCPGVPCPKPVRVMTSNASKRSKRWGSPIFRAVVMPCCLR